MALLVHSIPHARPTPPPVPQQSQRSGRALPSAAVPRLAVLEGTRCSCHRSHLQQCLRRDRAGAAERGAWGHMPAPEGCCINPAQALPAFTCRRVQPAAEGCPLPWQLPGPSPAGCHDSVLPSTLAGHLQVSSWLSLSSQSASPGLWTQFMVRSPCHPSLNISLPSSLLLGQPVPPSVAHNIPRPRLAPDRLAGQLLQHMALHF